MRPSRSNLRALPGPGSSEADAHGLRPGDPQRHGGRRFRPRLLPGRRRRRRATASPSSAASASRGAREIDAEGHVVTPGFIDGHTHMDAQVFWDATGSQLVLARGDLGGHGQLRLHPGPGPGRRAGPGGAQPRAGRGHRPGRAGRRHRLELRDLPRVPRRRRPAPQGDQLRRQHRALGPAHLGHGRAGLRGGGHRRRPRPHAGPAGRRRSGRGHRLLHVAHRAPRDLRRPAGGLPAGVVGRGGRAGRGAWATLGHRHLRGRRRRHVRPRPRGRGPSASTGCGPGRRHPGADDLRPGGHPRRRATCSTSSTRRPAAGGR